MNEIIKISQNEKGENVVSARELHAFLEIKNHFTQWIKDNLTQFEERTDYQATKVFLSHVNKVGGSNKTDYALTIDCAKQLAMMSKVEKGKKARLYFLECERISKELSQPKLPTTYLEALKELVVKEEKILQLEESNAKLQFRSDFVDVAFDTEGVFSMEEVSKIIKLPYGRNTMMQKLRDLGILLSSNTPKQNLITSGYFKVVESLVDNGKFKKLISTTYATQKGLGYIYKKLKEDGEQ